MRFARRSFTFAGTVGLLMLLPMFFLYDRIGTDPIRFRPLMPAAMVEKFFYIAAMATLYLQGRQTLAQFAVTGADMLFGTLFVISYLKTASGAR